MSDAVVLELERMIRTDPGRRGLISREPLFGPLLPGHLAPAAAELAHRATSVAIITGFYIPTANPPAAETDGPLGALILAETLRRLGVESTVYANELCWPVLQAAAASLPFPLHFIQSVSSSHFSVDIDLSRYSHLIAIESVGPSHTRESIQTLHPGEPSVWEQFERLIPPEDCDHCFNMRGLCIDQYTVPFYQLFEQARAAVPRIVTIGIGDGGNEIGMGSIPWPELARRLPDPPGGKIACRIPCDWTILAGVSNWGGYALAAAVAHLRKRIEILQPWTGTQQWEWLQAIVRDGPAVDGVTRLAEPTVDGLPFATYIQPWDAMRQLLGLPR